MMKKIFLLFALITVASLCYSQSVEDTVIDPVKAAKATSIVQEYMRLWIEGADMDSLTALCNVPFAWDRKEVISDIKQLRTELINTRAGKKALKLTLDTIYVRRIRHEILDNVVPVDVYYVVARFRRSGSSDSDNVLFAVQMTTEPKIVGISD